MSKTTPQTVHEAHLASFSGKLNMVAAAAHCGLTLREFKMTFREFLKYNPVSYTTETATQLKLF
tara:strand:- start:10085 stop:10276 length:192 start_codon:yes stop_codon:yes gene_type:complete